jgi:hypothetical protein
MDDITYFTGSDYDHAREVELETREEMRKLYRQLSEDAWLLELCPACGRPRMEHEDIDEMWGCPLV